MLDNIFEKKGHFGLKTGLEIQDMKVVPVFLVGETEFSKNPHSKTGQKRAIRPNPVQVTHEG